MILTIAQATDMIHEAYHRIAEELKCVSPMTRVFDYPRWYDLRQRELEEVWPPR